MNTTSGFRRQHRELQQLAARLMRESVQPKANAGEIRRHLSRFVGKLRVHAAMETDALYPSLLESSDAEVRRRAARLHEELGPLYGLVDEFMDRWDTVESIDQRRVRFRIELTRMIAKLGWRMMREDRELYPMVDAGG